MVSLVPVGSAVWSRDNFRRRLHCHTSCNAMVVDTKLRTQKNPAHNQGYGKQGLSVFSKNTTGARSRNRTGTPLFRKAADFKSDVSTSFTTRAALVLSHYFLLLFHYSVITSTYHFQRLLAPKLRKGAIVQ